MKQGIGKQMIVTLRDGTPVRVRLVRPDDRARLQRGVHEMSRTSRYMRFFVSTCEMTEEQARYFTEIDQINHVAVCAVDPTDAEHRGYGIARFVRDVGNPHTAEFAVAVIDEIQGRGLGTILMAALYLRAQALGVVELYSETLAENPIVPNWLPRLGATLHATTNPAHRLLRWPIGSAGSPLRVNNRYAQAFVTALDQLCPSFGP
jgi:GNAT superfamily N-acetyltransferase